MPINLAPVRAANAREAADDPLMSFVAETDIASEPPQPRVRHDQPGTHAHPVQAAGPHRFADDRRDCARQRGHLRLPDGPEAGRRAGSCRRAGARDGDVHVRTGRRNGDARRGRSRRHATEGRGCRGPAHARSERRLDEAGPGAVDRPRRDRRRSTTISGPLRPRRPDGSTSPRIRREPGSRLMERRGVSRRSVSRHSRLATTA